jgi:hypothetical protein
MRVKLVQLDGTLMNLALAKLGTYHRQRGDQVARRMADPDLVYYSAIFTWTADQFRGQTPLEAKAVFGGYPFNDDHLPPEAEFCKPAYDLWGVDYSLGYTSRGCIRRCAFCIVPKKEGRIRDYQFVGDFHDAAHTKIILLDNNFFASPQWRRNLEYINNNGLRVCFNQGLDLRLITPEIAGLLADTRSEDHAFKRRRYYFAWDFMKNEKPIRAGLQALLDAGVKGETIVTYVLTMFDTTCAQDLYRCETLWEKYGVHPFVMKYDRRKDNPFENHLARWANRPAARRNHTFREYCHNEGFDPEPYLKGGNNDEQQ